MSEPAPFVQRVRIPPEGQCATCRHAIFVAAEVTAEVEYQSRAHPLLYTAERTGGEGVRPALYATGLARIFAERGVRVEDVGLCETGYEGNCWITRQTGTAVDGDGRRTDACAGWKAMDERAAAVRSAFWRRDRDQNIRLAELRRSAGGKVEIRPTDPCPCLSGKSLQDCCVKPGIYKR